MSVPKWYLDGLDQIELAVKYGNLDADTAFRRRLALIRDLFIEEGGSNQQFLDLLTQVEVLHV